MIRIKAIICMILLSAALYAQEVKLTITDLLSIGGPDVTGKEYQFDTPVRVEADSKGNIYMQEWKQERYGNGALIQHFSPDGKFVKQIGRHGEGPGDFRKVSTFFVTPDDKLMIFDDNQYRITKYDYTTKKFEIAAQVNPPFYDPEIYVLNQNKLLVLAGSYNQKKTKNLLFIKSYNWKTNYYDFGHPSLFINSNDRLIDDKIGNSATTLSLAVIDENTIIAAPYFYDGELTMLSNTGREWKAKRFSGFKPKYGSFEKADKDIFEKPEYREMIHATLGSGSSFNYAYIGHSISSKLMIFKNKYILHFYFVCRHPSAVDYSLDVFDLNGKYLGRKVIYSRMKDQAKNEGRSIHFYSKDKNDNFYLVERVDGIPVIRKVKLDITF